MEKDEIPYIFQPFIGKMKVYTHVKSLIYA